MGEGRNRYAGLRWRMGGARAEEQIREEFEHHLAARIEEYVASGMTPESARSEALRRLGDVDRYVAETRAIDASVAHERRRRELLSGAGREMKQSLRALRRSPLFAAAAVITLGLGLGATGAVYTLLDAVVLKPLPYAGAERLVYIASRVTGGGTAGQWGLSPAGYFYYRDNQRTLSGLGVYSQWAVNVSGDGEAERAWGALVNAELFTVLNARVVAGRLMRAEETLPGAASVVLLSHAFWMRRYGGDAGVVGRTIQVDANPAEVIGVLAAGFALPQGSPDVWMPRRLNPAGPFFNEHSLGAVARLRDGETIETAQRDLAQLTARFTEVYPQVYPESFIRDYGFAVEVLPLRDQVLGSSQRTLWILFAAVGLVLLIACANVANLVLVRAEVKRREGAIRSAIGAERGHLAWHYITESLLVAMIGAVLGLGLAAGALGVLRRAAPDGIPRLAEVSLGGNTVWLLLAMALGLGILFGVFPLLRAARDSALVLREGGRGASASRRQGFVRGVLVTAQVALALTLLTGAGLMLRSFARLQAVEPGVEPEGVLTGELTLPWGRYRTYEQTNSFYRDLLERLESLPGVERAAVSTVLPLGGAGFCSVVFVEDRPLEPGQEPPCLLVALASPGFFDVMGITVDGRSPTWTDNDSRSGAVVVSRALAERFWPGDAALGRGIRSNGADPPFYRVAGVTADLHMRGLDEPPTEVVFYPLMPIAGAQLWSPPTSTSLVVRARTTRPMALLPDVRRVLAELDADVPLSNVQPFESVVAGSMARRSFAMMLLAVAATMALVLSAVGIYGVISYVVGQRRAEMGIRLALGARSSEMALMVVTQALRLVAFGLIAGFVFSLASTRALQSLLFDVSPTDPLTLGAVSLLILSLATLAAWMPARRAARINPVEVMRAE
jgi:predicted permease